MPTSPRCVVVSIPTGMDATLLTRELRGWLPEDVEVRPVDTTDLAVDLTDGLDGVLAEAPGARRRSSIDVLSRREREVLQELVDGHSVNVAATNLYISRHTLRTHSKNILTKLGVHSSLEAVSVAVRDGMRPSVARPQAG